jgi:lysozyme
VSGEVAGNPSGLGERARRLLRRHKHLAETAGEAIGANLAYPLAKRALAAIGLSAGVAAAAVLVTTGGHTYHPNYNVSAKGLAFLVRNEGEVDHLYNDPFNCTDGVGHLVHMSPCTAGDYRAVPSLTHAQVLVQLASDVQRYVAAVRQDVTHPISQPQFDALVDFTFNVGTGSLASSSVLRDVNAGDFTAVPAALNLWTRANGVVLGGLVTRRAAEGHLFLTGDYGAGIGRYVPPRPLTRADRLRARTGYWAWLDWYLGEGPWKPYKPRTARVRPHVARHVTKAWWRREKRFMKARGR